MIVYSIARKVSQTYGHGDCGSELMIAKEGAYGAGPFPPVFAKRKNAEIYMAEKLMFSCEIVELELLDCEIP